jgi:hypothetical protein
MRANGFDPALARFGEIVGHRIDIGFPDLLDLERPARPVTDVADKDERSRIVLEIDEFLEIRRKPGVSVRNHADLFPKLAKGGADGSSFARRPPPGTRQPGA